MVSSAKNDRYLFHHYIENIKENNLSSIPHLINYTTDSFYRYGNTPFLKAAKGFFLKHIYVFNQGVQHKYSAYCASIYFKLCIRNLVIFIDHFVQSIV